MKREGSTNSLVYIKTLGTGKALLQYDPESIRVTGNIKCIKSVTIEIIIHTLSIILCNMSMLRTVP